MPAPYERLFTTLALYTGGYFLVLVATGALSRLAFDFIAAMCFLALLVAWLASSGLDAGKVLLMIAAHVAATAGADRQLKRRARRPGRAPDATEGALIPVCRESANVRSRPAAAPDSAHQPR